jgi:GNAT superfamily N-acetyltransferase
MKFVVGCDLEEFKRYYRRNGYDKGDLEHLIKKVIKDSSQLIVWRKNDKIVGHAVWHESNTREHRKGDPRDEEDKEALEKLLEGKKDFVELHKIWLMKEYRGKSHGKRFFEFFEDYMKSRGYDSIVYYADHPAAIAICRKRGCKEEYLKTLGEYAFYLRLNHSS